MNKMLLIISSMVMLSCTSFIDEDFINVEPDFEYYYQVFITEASLRNINLPIGNLMIHYQDRKEGDIIGAVQARCDGVTEITFDKHLFNQLDSTLKEIVVIHELGHGLLHYKHIGECQIMSFEVTLCQRSEYLNDRKSMLDQFFQQSN